MIAKCKLITPMFPGSAIPGEAELRPPALKGALRFWWRALHGQDDVEKTRLAENEIFGSTDLRSQLLLRMEPVQGKWKTSNGANFSSPTLKYLSYGCHEMDDEDFTLARQCAVPGNEFVIHLEGAASQNTQVGEALTALSFFGGLGAKTRNGFGKFSIEGKSADYLGFLKRFQKGEIKPFTAFSEKLRLFRTEKTFDTWQAALETIGEAYKYARVDIDPKPNQGGKRSIQNRKFIALPIVANGKPQGLDDLDRHAKSYFLSVVEEEEDYFRGLILFLPCRFAEGFDRQTPKPKISSNAADRYNEVTENFNDFLAGNPTLEDITPPIHKA